MSFRKSRLVIKILSNGRYRTEKFKNNVYYLGFREVCMFWFVVFLILLVCCPPLAILLLLIGVAYMVFCKK